MKVPVRTVGNMKALFAQKALYSSSRILPPDSLPLPVPPVAEPLGGGQRTVDNFHGRIGANGARKYMFLSCLGGEQEAS